jgi:hypothetical protein
MAITIKYAIGYGMGTSRDKRPDEKTLEVYFEDLGLSSTATDEQIRDAVWDAVLDDIKRNAVFDDVLDNFDEVEMEIHEAMAMARSREEAAKKTSPTKHKLTAGDRQALKRKTRSPEKRR